MVNYKILGIMIAVVIVIMAPIIMTNDVSSSERLPNDYVFEGTIDRHSRIHSFTSSGGNHCVLVKDAKDTVSISCTKGQY